MATVRLLSTVPAREVARACRAWSACRAVLAARGATALTGGPRRRASRHVHAQREVDASQLHALRRGDRTRDQDADRGGDLSRHRGQDRARPRSTSGSPEVPLTSRMPCQRPTPKRAEHGESELLDEIVSAKPKMDHTRDITLPISASAQAVRRIRARSRRACARTVITRCSSTTSGRRSRCACTSCPSCPTGRMTTWSALYVAGAFRSATPSCGTYVRCPPPPRRSAQACSQARYMAQVERFWRQLGVNPAGQHLAVPAMPGTPARSASHAGQVRHPCPACAPGRG